MAIGGVVITFKADADKARKDIDKLTKTLGGVDNTARTASSGISKLAKAGVAAVAVGAAMGAAALYDFAKAAAADWQEAEKLKRTLKAVPGITDAMVAANARWIDSMEIATGFSDTEFRNSISRLAVATGSLTEAQTLAALAADVAAARNISLATASGLLEKAAAGNTAQLKRQMPWLDANRDGTITMAEAVKGLTAAYGGAAEAAADNNPWLRIQAVWAQMKEALGSFILPFLERLGTWFSDKKNPEALQGWIEKAGEFSYEIGEKLVNAIETTLIPFIENDLLPALQKIVDWFGSPDGREQIRSWSDYLKTFADALGTVLANLDTLFGALNKLPGNVVLQKLGLIPKFDFSTGGGGEPRSYPRSFTQEQANALGARRRTTEAASRRTVNVTINNPKTEKAEDSAALAIRVARATRRTGGF